MKSHNVLKNIYQLVLKHFFYYNWEKKRKKNMSNDTHSKINKKKQLWKRLLLLKSKIIKERCF